MSSFHNGSDQGEQEDESIEDIEGDQEAESIEDSEDDQEAEQGEVEAEQGEVEAEQGEVEAEQGELDLGHDSTTEESEQGEDSEQGEQGDDSEDSDDSEAVEGAAEEEAKVPETVRVIHERWSEPVTVAYKPISTLTMISRMMTSVCNDLKIIPNDTFYFKGGCVRDMIHGVESFADVDVVIHRSPVISPPATTPATTTRMVTARTFLSAFQKLLVLSDRLQRSVSGGNGPEQYSHVKFWIDHGGSSVCLDFTLRNTIYGRKSDDVCDFTCNNLIMRPDGSISTRLKPPSFIEDYDDQPARWTMKCIQDCIAKKLIFMEKPKREGQHILRLIRLLRRQSKMLSKGYTFQDPSQQLTPYRTIAAVEGPRTDLGPCPICHDEYAEGTQEETILLACNHHYHLECFEQTLMSGRKTCAVCRRNVAL
jgi:hypothetical protein